MLGKMATDVALPAEATLAELLPAVLPQFGAEWIEQGADHEGWVVQRVGEDPLDEDRTLAELNLLDGETVYLRPRADQLAAIDYDDLVDGVGEQVREHAGTWKPRHTRWMFRIGAAGVLLFGLVLIPGIGSGVIQACVAFFAAAMLLGGSALVVRSVGDVPAATILAGMAVLYGAEGGVLVVRAVDPAAAQPALVTTALAIALLVLSLGAFAVADSALLFAGAIMAVLIVIITSLIGTLFDVTGSEAAGIGLAIALLIGVFLPATAFRLSGLTLPMLPTGADELSDDIEPVPAKMVIERGRMTAGYSTALHVGLGSGLSVLLPMLIAEGGAWQVVLSLDIAALLLLRSRHPSGVVQRWSVIVPAVVSVIGTLWLAATSSDELVRLLAVFVPMFGGGAVLMLFSRVLPGRRLRPYWGRAVEIFESLTAIAVLPILLQVLGVYAWMRGLAG